MERNWQWIRSDDNFGYFIDVDNAYNHKTIENEIDYSDVWVKVAYTYSGAQNEIDFYDIKHVSADKLSAGYGLYKLRLHYLSGDVEYLYLGFYDNNSNLLATAKPNKTTIYCDGFLEPILLYMSAKITGGKEFSSIAASGKAIRTFKHKTPSGQIRLFNVPVASIRKSGNQYHYVLDYRVLAPDNSVDKEMSEYITFSGADEYWLERVTIYDDDWKLYFVDKHEKKEFIPGTYLEHTKDFVLKYCSEHSDIVNRFGAKGLICK